MQNLFPGLLVFKGVFVTSQTPISYCFLKGALTINIDSYQNLFSFWRPISMSFQKIFSHFPRGIIHQLNVPRFRSFFSWPMSIRAEATKNLTSEADTSFLFIPYQSRKRIIEPHQTSKILLLVPFNNRLKHLMHHEPSGLVTSYLRNTSHFRSVHAHLIQGHVIDESIHVVKRIGVLWNIISLGLIRALDPLQSRIIRVEIGQGY